jgi:molecular chaperone GrpE
MSDHEDSRAEPPDEDGAGAETEVDGSDDKPVSTAEDGATETEEQSEEETANQLDPAALIDAVEEHDESLAEDVAALVDQVDELESEVDRLESDLETAEERLERTRADFQNYKERAKRRREEEKERATEDLVERLLEVRDNLGRALSEESGSVESLREGVELTRKQFDRVLEEENVERIEPEPGAEVDPNRHEVMMRVESDQPGGTVTAVYRPGYAMAEQILRPAQVTVAEESDTEQAEEADEDRTDGDDASTGGGTDEAAADGTD